MKKIFILSFALITCISIYAQSCLPNGITFNTQAQIDNFPTNYPGCTEIEGDVTIREWENIFNLDSLSVLHSIGGNLLIETTPSLTSLNGLKNLSSIGGDLRFEWQSALTDLTGLENLKSIGGGFSIYGNSSIKYLTGLENLTSIGGSLSIVQSAVTSLTGLKNLNSIGGSFSIYISSLTSLAGLENLTSIGGSFTMSVSSMTSLAGLENLTSIGGFMHIWSNNDLNSLAAFNNLKSVGGALWIMGNPLLTSLIGLENVETATITELNISNNTTLSSCDALTICNYLANPGGSVTISSNANGCNSPSEVADKCGIELPCLPFGNYYFNNQADVDSFALNYPDCTELLGDVVIQGSVENLEGLAHITIIRGNLEIKSDTLANLKGLDNLVYLGGNLIITGICEYFWPNGYKCFSSLTSLSGLEKLNFIGGNLLIGPQLLLTNFNGLNNLKTLGGDLIIIGTSLTNFAGLNKLTSIGGNLQLGPRSDSGWFPEDPPPGNPTLTNLTGLENLTSIGGDVEIDRNYVLTSLTGLNNVKSIGGHLYIWGNPALTSLTGINNVKSIGGNLYIWDNPVLSSCVVQSICDYLASPNGTFGFNNNAPGCNSPAEVEAACIAVSVNELLPADGFSVYPNPSSSLITIKISFSSANSYLSVINLEGQELLYRQISEPVTAIDISMLPAGVYFVRLAGKRMVGVQKIVKY